LSRARTDSGKILSRARSNADKLLAAGEKQWKLIPGMEAELRERETEFGVQMPPIEERFGNICAAVDSLAGAGTEFRKPKG